MSDEFLNFIWLTAKSLLSSAMEKLKLAKGNAIPHLMEDGSNYQEWRSSYVAFYCTQINTVMEIAKQSDLKPETIDMEDAKMMTLTIFECIHQNLRVVYVGQRDLLQKGYKLWRTLELRFHTVNQVQTGY